MRLVLVVCALAGLSLGACETPQETEGYVYEEVNKNEEETAKNTPEGTTGITVEQVDALPPGSAEDFAVNVGDRVQFGFDRYELTQEAQSVIEDQVVWLLRFPAKRVTIEGHTDERGTREYNLALGERRAISVRDYMIALGVDPSRITTISFGKERPIDPASSEAAWSLNRRAVTVIEEGLTGSS